MVVKTITGALLGIECHKVQVEVDVSPGLPGMDMVGSLGMEVREARERVRVALQNSGISLPSMRITVNLSPADIRKEGTSYDLPIAAALLVAAEYIEISRLNNVYFAGEIGLNGEIKGVKGMLPMLLEAKKWGITSAVLSYENYAEASHIDGLEIYPVESLLQLLDLMTEPEESLKEMQLHLQNEAKARENKGKRITINETIDFMQIRGQENLKKALVIAAAGFHNILMLGPPGAGKSLSAKAIPSILPPMDQEEILEVSKIYSVAGLLSKEKDLIRIRPFISPHHTITEAAFAGSGKIPKPGEISKAHKGVLFLDEIAHFSSLALESLRQPLEDKEIRISRSGGTYSFPADVMLVGAMNPCPCGYYPDFTRCNCTPEKINRYLSKISGPILDRMDLCVEVEKMDWNQLNSQGEGSRPISSEELRQRVEVARKRQEKRYRGSGIHFNSELNSCMLDQYIELHESVLQLLEKVYEKYHLSARSYHRLLKVIRTIADLEDKEEIMQEHVLAGISYRGMESKYWGS